MRVYKMEEWKSGSGLYYCEDITLLGRTDININLIPMRILGLAPTDFIKMLIKDYNAKIFRIGNFIGYSFENQSDMRRFKNKVNKISREKNYLV